jgi:hypothetical protein
MTIAQGFRVLVAGPHAQKERLPFGDIHKFSEASLRGSASAAVANVARQARVKAIARQEADWVDTIE